MIKDWIEDLLTLTDEDWCRYAFNRDPLIGRITPTEQLEFCKNARECAYDQARKLRSEYGQDSPENLVKRMGINLIFKRGESSNGYTLFAYYEEPDTITIYLDNANATDKLITDEGLSNYIGNVNTCDLLITHELYHYLEHNIPGIYTAQKLITLWKLGPIINRSRILCLQEIGAMAFAKEFIGLNCSALLFDVLMLFPKNRAATIRNGHGDN